MSQVQTQTQDQDQVFEMYYDTWGSFGQHRAQHVLFVINNELINESRAVELGIATVDIRDAHSRKNLHYNRIYKLVKDVDGIIYVTCHASSSRHESNVIVGFDKTNSIKVEQRESKYCKYLIKVKDKGYCLEGCFAGKDVHVESAEVALEKERIELEKERLKAEIERRKREEPQLILKLDNGDLLISGDTYQHKETIKLVAKALGTQAIWDHATKSWRIKNCIYTTAVAQKLREFIPKANIMIS